MPKDPTKNVDRYKIRGGQLNEFDFHQNREEFAEQPKGRADNLIPGTPPEAKVEGLRPVVAEVRKPVKSVATKGAKGTKATKAKKASPRGASAKKLAAPKASNKK